MRNRLAILGAFGVLFAVPIGARADFVFLKDGFTLRGNVLKEGTLFQDAGSGRSMWMPKAGGFYLVDDYVRHIIFSVRQLAAARGEPGGRGEEVFELIQPGLLANPKLSIR
jgi:hypothetical protein